MKSGILLLLTSLAAVMASPTPQDGETAAIVERATCKHPGECRWNNSGQCEYHCDGYGGFDFMQDCGWLRGRCCCNKSG
jgi:hypothetical protein